MSLVLITAAMPAEFAPLARRLARPRRVRLAPRVRALRGELGGRRVLLVPTGVGSPAANRALRAVLVREVVAGDDAIRLVVSTGVAGALTGHFGLADLALAQQAVDVVQAQSAPSPDAASSDGIARHLGPQRIQRAIFVTSQRVVSRAEAKRTLAREVGATETPAVVDQETAAVARAADGFGVPWIGLRGISDLVDDDLPLDFERLQRDDGTLRTLAAMAHLGVRPWKFGAMHRLRRAVARAAEQVAVSLEDALSAGVI